MNVATNTRLSGYIAYIIRNIKLLKSFKITEKLNIILNKKYWTMGDGSSQQQLIITIHECSLPSQLTIR